VRSARIISDDDVRRAFSTFTRGSGNSNKLLIGHLGETSDEGIGSDGSNTGELLREFNKISIRVFSEEPSSLSERDSSARAKSDNAIRLERGDLGSEDLSLSNSSNVKVEVHAGGEASLEEDAFNKAKEMANLDSAQLVNYKPKLDYFKDLFESKNESPIPSVKTLIEGQTPQFMYMWTAGGSYSEN